MSDTTTDVQAKTAHLAKRTNQINSTKKAEAQGETMRLQLSSIGEDVRTYECIIGQCDLQFYAF